MNFYGQSPALPDVRTPPFSGAVETEGMVYVSGQLAVRDGRIEGDVAQQTHKILDGIEAVLAEAGLTLANVVKVTVWLTHPRDFDAFNAAYASRLQEPYPARSCVVSQLVVTDARLEIDAVASRAGKRH